MSSTTRTPTHQFSTDPTGLPAAVATETMVIGDGDTCELRISAVANRVGDDTVRMIAYNGSVPGPTLRVRQGSEITVRVHNDGDYETTVHWHGLRVANQYDGVPFETQAPIPVGGEFTYRLRFPDDGLYWYHPHVREDYGIELGLYGCILVDPDERSPWPPVNHEVIATLDDLLIENGRIASFSTEGPTYTAMGRFGNVMLTSGKTDPRLDVHEGDVVRFFVVNTANTRIFNVSIPGARMKLVGGDSGRLEREQFASSVLLSPSERTVIDVLFDAPGEFAIEHTAFDTSYRLGAVTVATDSTETSHIDSFLAVHENAELAEERARLDVELTRAPDKTLVLDSEMPLLYGASEPQATQLWTCPMHPDVLSADAGACPKCGMRLIPATQSWTCPMHADVVSAEQGTCPKCGMKLVPSSEAPAAMDHHLSGHGHGAGNEDSGDGLEWEDQMPEINAQTDDTNMIWKLVDQDTGKVNHDIDWAFRVGDRVKLRLINTMDSDHPMHHPFHIHGAGRFLVIARDDKPEPNLTWKDTVLVRAGETVDIVLELTSPGTWMAHCHIAEHNQNGMMFSFRVDPA